MGVDSPLVGGRCRRCSPRLLLPTGPAPYGFLSHSLRFPVSLPTAPAPHGSCSSRLLLLTAPAPDGWLIYLLPAQSNEITCMYNPMNSHVQPMNCPEQPCQPAHWSCNATHWSCRPPHCSSLLLIAHCPSLVAETRSGLGDKICTRCVQDLYNICDKSV